MTPKEWKALCDRATWYSIAIIIAIVCAVSILSAQTTKAKKVTPPAKKKASVLITKLTPHSVTLRFTQGALPAGATPVTSNNIYRGVSSGTETLLQNTSVTNPGTFTDSTVVAGAPYCYQVTSINSGGESARSNEFCVTVPNVLAPILSSISPATIAATSSSVTVTLTGSNFTNISVPSINGVAVDPAFFTFVNSTTMTVMIGGGTTSVPGTIAFSVTTPGGGTSASINFTVTAPLPVPLAPTNLTGTAQ